MSPTKQENSPSVPAQKFFKRFPLRTTSPERQAAMVEKLRAYEPQFKEFFSNMFDELVQPPDGFAQALGFAQHGDWYVADDGNGRIGLIALMDRERSAQLIPWRVRDEHIKKAIEYNLSRYHLNQDTHQSKIKAEVPEDVAEQLERVGFRRVGVWLDDALIEGEWLNIIALEYPNFLDSDPTGIGADVDGRNEHGASHTAEPGRANRLQSGTKLAAAARRAVVAIRERLKRIRRFNGDSAERRPRLVGAASAVATAKRTAN